MAERAGSTGRPPRDALGADEPSAGLFLPAQSANRTLRWRSETVTQGTVCGKSARTGLGGCRRVTAGTTRRTAGGRGGPGRAWRGAGAALVPLRRLAPDI